MINGVSRLFESTAKNVALEPGPVSLRRRLPGDARVGDAELTVGILSGSHAINHMYFVLLPPLFGVLAGEFEVGLAAIGTAAGAVGVAGTVFQIPYGFLADRHDRLLAFGLSSFLGAAGVFVTALAPSFAWLVAGQLLLGAGVAGHHPAHYPMVVNATSDDRRGRALGVYEFAGLAGFAVTPVVISAALGTGFGWRDAVAGIGLLGAGYSLLAGGLLIAGVDPAIRHPPESGTGGDASGSALSRAKRGLYGLFDAPAILAMTAFAFLVGIVNWGFVSYVVVLLTDGYALAFGAANLILTGVFVFSGIWVLYGGVIIDTVARGPDTVIVGSFGLAAPLVALAGTLAFSPLVAVLLVLLVGAAQGPSVPAVSTVAEALSTEANLGRNMAIITVGTYAGNGIAPPVVGAIIEGPGLQAAFLALAVVGLLASVLMLGITRRYGDRAALRRDSSRG